MAALGRTLDRIVAGIVRAGEFLVLPLGFLLFAQWPLREVVQAYSREANDLAQCLFALYVSIAITCATRAQAHLATDVLAQCYTSATRDSLRRWGTALVLVPWSLFILYAAWPMVAQSVRQMEGFPESYNPGYFMLKIALLLAASLVLLQALRDAFRSGSEPAP